MQQPPVGIEPTTFGLQDRCSSHWAMMARYESDVTTLISYWALSLTNVMTGDLSTAITVVDIYQSNASGIFNNITQQPLSYQSRANTGDLASKADVSATERWWHVILIRRWLLRRIVLDSRKWDYTSPAVCQHRYRHLLVRHSQHTQQCSIATHQVLVETHHMIFGLQRQCPSHWGVTACYINDATSLMLRYTWTLISMLTSHSSTANTDIDSHWSDVLSIHTNVI